MKKTNIIIVVFLLAMIYACGGTGKKNNNNEQNLQETKDTATDEIKPDVAEQVDLTASFKRYKFQCLINGKIPVDMTIEVKDDIIQGSIVYTKTKAKNQIRLLGEVVYSEKSSEQLYFSEIAHDGTTTGIIKGIINEQGKFEGTWSAPDKYVEKKGDFSYIQGKSISIITSKIIGKDTTLHSDNTISWKTNTKNPYGIYKYSLGEYCAYGELKLFNKNNKLICKIDASTSAPSFNMATVENQECKVEEKHLVCNLLDWEACKFAIYTFEDFAIIRYIDNQSDCGFGRNASIEGMYLKIK